MTSLLPSIISGLTSGALAFGLLYFIFRNHLKSYLTQKGKNLADKEDVAALTAAVEAVKADYARQMSEVTHKFNLMLESAKTSNQLRMAALDARLRAHQEAFTLWRKLIASLHSENSSDVIIECRNWWNKNCLYLEPAARKAFADAYFCAGQHKALLQGGKSFAGEVTTNWGIIAAAADIIMNAVALPGLTSNEKGDALAPINPQ